MKRTKAVIGGEGNGGVIYPDLHYGRDALVGIVMVMNLLADRQCTLSELKETYPVYHIVKSSLKVKNDNAVNKYLKEIEKSYLNEKLDKTDGLKILWDDGWVHIRSSNTEPIIRVIAEATTISKAKSLVQDIFKIIYEK